MNSFQEDINIMGNLTLFEKIHELTDLELALLVSLVAGQHCLIEADEEALYPLQQEIQLVRSPKHISLIDNR